MRPNKKLDKIVISRDSKLLQAELAISYMLRFGVILCATIIAFGLALRLIHYSVASNSAQELVQNLVRGKVLTSRPTIHSVEVLESGLAILDPDAVVTLGLLCLIALPVLRVGMTVILFAAEKDFTYVAITLWVFSVLITGFFMGKAF